MQERILDRVLRGVGRRQRHRDHEIRGRKAEEDQDAESCLSSPCSRFSSIAIEPCPAKLRRATCSVDRQSAEQRHEDQDNGRDRRDRARGEQRDAGLIPERREIVDAGEPYDFPPGMGCHLMAGMVG